MKFEWQILVESIAKRHDTTFRQAIAKGPGRDYYLLARVEMAKALSARGLSSTQIGLRLNRDHTSILWYLGRLGKSPPTVKVYKKGRR